MSDDFYRVYSRCYAIVRSGDSLHSNPEYDSFHLPSNSYDEDEMIAAALAVHDAASEEPPEHKATLKKRIEAQKNEEARKGFR